MKKIAIHVINFLKEFDFAERLNTLHLHYVEHPDERIDYLDFTSLYPYVNKTKTYLITLPSFLYSQLYSQSKSITT